MSYSRDSHAITAPGIISCRAIINVDCRLHGCMTFVIQVTFVHQEAQQLLAHYMLAKGQGGHIQNRGSLVSQDPNTQG